MKTLINTFTVFLLLFAFALPALPAHGFLDELTGCGNPVREGSGARSVLDAQRVPTTNPPLEEDTSDLRDKECIGDRLQHQITQALIGAVTNGIIEWVNSGFEGGPAFITDYRIFYRDIADDIALDFIGGDELGFLCSPFEEPVRAALTRNYQAQQNFSDHISCSLGDVSGNINDFLGGDFSQGGWRALFSLSTDFQNNPYYAYTQSLDELDSRIAAEQFLRREEVTDGFLSKGRCIADSSVVLNVVEDTTKRSDCLSAGGTWQITSPSSQISDTLSRVLQLPLERLAQADESGESLSEVYITLVQLLFTSLDGLRGLSSETSSSAFDGSSYLNQLTTETGILSVSEASEVLVADVSLAISLEETYQSAVDEILVGYQGAKESFETLSQQCSSSSASGASGVVSSTTSTLAAIESLITDYTNQRTLSVDTVGELVAIRAAAQTATTENALNNAGTTYERLLDQGRIHSVAATTLELEAQRNTFTRYNDEIQISSATCGV